MPSRSLFVLIALMGFAPAAIAAPTQQQLCESAMERALARYAQCRLNAESKFSKTLDAAKRTAALADCSADLDSAFSKATGKFGMACAATEPSSAFDDYLQQCSDDATAAAAGAALPDYVGDLAACEALPPASLLKTGQTTAYGAGSDGDLEVGIAQDYVDNGDGTITDTKTGLMWEKKSDDGTIHDQDNTYSWSGASYDTTNVLDGTAATTFLAALNAGAGFAGHTDWRLPNRKELESLTNLGVFAPSTFPAFNTGCGTPASRNVGCTVTTCSCTVPGEYWSSSTFFANGPQIAWGMNFSGAYFAANNKNVSYHVRAVRGDS